MLKLRVSQILKYPWIYSDNRKGVFLVDGG